MFYTTNVDISSPKSMWNFLHDHYHYHTMNSWNGMKSIANNVKLYNLNLEGDYAAALQFLYDECDVGDLQYLIQSRLEEFAVENPGFCAYFNGRSGGYLVLYSTDHNRSVLPNCVDNYDTYEEFKADCKYYGERVQDYLHELRTTTQLVRSFDRMCDDLRELVNEYSKMSYEDHVLASKIDLFNETYSSDLELLGIEPLELSSGEVDISSIHFLSCLTEALFNLFGSNRSNLEVEGGKLRVKEV